MKTIQNFTVKESANRRELLDEALEIMAYGDIKLGPETKIKKNDTTKQQMLDRFKLLKEEEVRFSPKLDVYKIDADGITEPKMEFSQDLQAKMRIHDFYRVNIPLTLKSKTGWAFTRLECEVGFYAGETDAAKCPIIYDMFPGDEWQNVLNANIVCRVKLDGNMKFKVRAVENMGFQPQSKMALQANNKFNLMFGPLDYQIRRSRIKARGRLDTTCFWQLDGKEYVDKEDLLLSVILMLPKRCTHPVSAVATAIARHDFQFFTADIMHDYFKAFDEKLKSLFYSGAPLKTSRLWENFIVF